jgi:HSP20 family protein
MLSLRDAMDRLLGESFIRPWFGEGAPFGGEALVFDMRETDNEVIVEAAVPGVKPEEIEVQVTGNTLTIKGERKEKKEEKRGAYLYQEQKFGDFSRSVTLPVEVNVDKACTEFENGVLTLTLQVGSRQAQDYQDQGQVSLACEMDSEELRGYWYFPLSPSSIPQAPRCDEGWNDSGRG